jgi:hypothetical protein
MALMENGERLKWLQSLAVFVFVLRALVYFLTRSGFSSTPKAFANESPRLLQPWVTNRYGRANAESVG